EGTIFNTIILFLILLIILRKKKCQGFLLPRLTSSNNNINSIPLIYGNNNCLWYLVNNHQNSLSEVIILPFSIIYFKISSHLFINQLYHIFNNIFVVIFVYQAFNNCFQRLSLLYFCYS